MEAELVLDAQATLGEGAVWHRRTARLYWVDIEQGEIHAFDPRTGVDEVHRVGHRVSAVVPRRRGGLMLALDVGFARFDPASGDLTLLGDPEADRPGNRFNDGKCDPLGRFWAGTISLARQQGTAALYCLDAKEQLRRMLSGLTNSNGIAFSPDASTMYHIDTPTLQVCAFDYRAETGEIGNRRVVVDVPIELGKPDGMTIDTEGMLWVALFRGGCVTRWDPRDGSLLATIRVPATQVSSCAFGGSKLDTLYITTARVGLSAEQLAEQPHAGGLFAARPGVWGMEAFEYAG